MEEVFHAQEDYKAAEHGLGQPVLYVEGALGSGKTRLLLNRAETLIRTRPSTSVLIFAANHTRQQRLIQSLYQRLDIPMGQLCIYTYLGFVRNTLFDWWPLVEQKILDTLPGTLSKLRPELSGLEDSELLLMLTLQALQQEKPEAFEAFPGNSRTLVKQLVRRLRLRSENRLNRTQMQRRSQTIEELCWMDTAEMERRFDKASYLLRILDSNKQLDVFHRLLEDTQDPICIAFQQEFRQRVRHLLVDDVDESIPAQHTLIRFLSQSVDSLCLTSDVDGGTRRGYLNAFPYAWPELKIMREGETLQLSPQLPTPIQKSASILLQNWRDKESVQPLPAECTNRWDHYLTRVEMLDGVVQQITEALAGGKQAGDFCIVLPQADVIGIYHLQQQFQNRGVPIQLVSGTQRPSDNPLVRAFLCLMQLVNRIRWWVPLSMWEMKTLLMQVLQLPVFSRDILDDLVRACVEHQAQLRQGTTLLPILSELPVTLPDDCAKRYGQLWEWLEGAQSQEFGDQLYSAFDTLIAPIASTEVPLSDLKRVLDSYARQRQLYDGYFAQLSQASDVEQMELLETVEPNRDFDRLWLLQAKSGVVADTPDMPSEPEAESLIIGTPQSVLNMQIHRPIHAWLDVGSREWCRSDHAPLYHAWIHSPLCSDEPEAINAWLDGETTERMLFEKAGHLTRTLMLLAKSELWLFASDMDSEGQVQEGPLLERTIVEQADTQTNTSSVPTIQLRDDQAPVLNYQQGLMAISAVPGAGKTFTNVALILHLIESVGAKPDQILVLTYMESAAKTLENRVKRQLEARGIKGKLPAISTIHSLAMRILTDNDHARRVGLMPQEFSILDDYRKEEILQGIQQRLQCKPYDRVIQNAKMMGITPDDVVEFLRQKPEHARLSEFYPAYNLYMQTMHEHGLLDFDDLILRAIALLEEHEDIRNYYQQKYRIIIEDEAQDSSKTLQRLLQLIAGEKGNIIRTGDTNQSITTTFSSADPSVFRDFIKNADLTVEMTYSARCASEVIALSNDWMQYCIQYPTLKEAFQWMEMRPVPNQNPDLLFSMYSQCFETSKQETQWLVESIGRLKTKYPDATVAVLVRRNDQVQHMCDHLLQSGIEAISFNNQLNNHPVFVVILAWLKLLSCPLSLDQMDKTVTLDQQIRLYQAYLDAKLLEHSPEKRSVMEAELLLFHPFGQIENPAFGLFMEAGLGQLYYDGIEFSTDVLSGQIAKLIIKMTNRLFQSIEARSNGYLCAMLAEQCLKRVNDLESLSPIEVVIQQFEQYQRSRSSKKGFAEWLQPDLTQVVQVMTLHKAKGQEFDIVLMPYLQQSYFRHDPNFVDFTETDRVQQALEEIKIMKSQKSAKAIDEHKSNLKHYELSIKQSVIEEETRLAYVGFTRAKKALILTAHTLNDALGYGRRKAEKAPPAFVFHWVSDWIQKRFYANVKTENTPETVEATSHA